MVNAINQVGHTLNIKTIAEFVENEKILAAVRRVGVDYAQGYIIAEPAPVEFGLYGSPADVTACASQNTPVQLRTVAANN